MDLRPPGFTRFSRFGVNLGRLHVTAATHSEGLDGTDSLQITCYEDLNKNDYIVWQDRRSAWHEHIVDEATRTHDSGGAPQTVATCINSINETWDDFVVDLRPRGGVQTALTSILTPTRWTAGTCTQTGEASHTFYHKSVRECLQELVETWGGELDTVITCDGSKVTGRTVRILSARGNQLSAKRFTWSKDLISIARTVGTENPKSRIYAYGKGEEAEAGGYGRRIGIDDVNDGLPYVEDADATQLWGHPMVGGTIAPACGIFIDEECDDPEVLLSEALQALDAAKVPTVSYTADVIDLVSFGRDWEDVSLGDLVTIIDKGFSDDGIRLRGRISRLDRDLFTYDTTVTFGNLVDALANPWQSMQEKLEKLSQRSANWDLAGEAGLNWLDVLISSLNAKYNQVGTYHYSSFEQGEIWSSVPLDQNGHATQSGGWAMNINGLGFRLAAGLNADGSWNWRTFGDGTGFTADEITAGILHSAGWNTYINLTTGEALISAASTLGDRTVQDVLDGVDATITDVDVEYAESQSATTAPVSGWSTVAPAWREGYYVWQRTATTTADGTTYSEPTCISGRDGVDGQDGNDGTGITTSVVEYGTSNSASTQPSSWSGTAPSSITNGKWLWTRITTTYSDGTSTVAYSKSYVGTNGQDGADGTSVTIKGSYNTYADLIAAHPTGNSGDSYMVGGDLYVWNGSSWEDVGTIQGPQGPAGTNGTNGTSVTVTSIQYGTSNSASTQPSSWSTTAPTSITKGKWLWVKTTYSDGSTAVTKSYAGTNGTNGTNGTSVTVTSIQYGTSNSASTQPSSWSTTAPTSITKGKWLWVKTTYSDNTVATTKSYVGTDGTDGKSVYVLSSTKSGGTTTVVLTDGTTQTTLTINDGDDGDDGTPGLNGYVHTAWATSADGSQGFSTSVSAGKTYLGTYTDNTAADSQTYSDYSWSLIKGADGDDGVGISSIVEQYYLSTSSATRSGGSWGTSQPEWELGKYIWTRSKITWDDGSTSTTTPVLAKALNGANQSANDAMEAAEDAAQTATGYIRTTDGGIELGDMLGDVTLKRLLLSPTNIDFLDNETVIASIGATIALGAAMGYHMQVTPSAIEFYEGVERRAYLAGNKFYAANTEVEDAFFIGSYTLRTAPDGSFTISKRS